MQLVGIPQPRVPHHLAEALPGGKQFDFDSTSGKRSMIRSRIYTYTCIYVYIYIYFHAEMSWKQQNTFSFMKWGYHALYTDVS